MSSDLSVLANFSQPEINLLTNHTENSVINLTCSSTQGYPEPQRMYMLLNTKNSTTEHDADMKKSQNNITELYNVSIRVSLPIPPETNVSIVCVLQLEPSKTLLFSLPCNIDAKPPVQPPVPDHILWIAALLVTVVVVCGMVSFVTLRKRKKKQPGPSNECGETIKMNRKASEQTKNRAEVHERSDDAQCDVNILKTASDDNSTTDF